MYKLKNNEIYDKTIDFIFSFDKNSNKLTLNMVKSIFSLYGLEQPQSLSYFEKYYGTSNLTKNVLKPKDQAEEFDENYIKNSLKNYSDGNKLNINSLYNDIKKINPNINKDDFNNYIIKNIFNNSDNDINKFYNYILNLLK